MLWCSTFALLSLHLFMYGCNLLMWKSTRINYTFIFEFSPKTALKYRDAFLICTSLMTSVVGALVIHLILRSSGFSAQQVDIIPGILLLVSHATSHLFLYYLPNIILCCNYGAVTYYWPDEELYFSSTFDFQIFLVMLICPLNVFYRSTRYSFLKVLRNIVFSPFYKVCTL